MPTINLAPPPGVARGATPATTPGRWWDANLVRWHGGGLMPIGGWLKLNSTALSSIPRRIMPWADNTGVRRTAIACEGHLYIEEGGTFTDVTPDTFTAADWDTTTGGYGTGVYSGEEYGDERTEITDVDLIPYAYSLCTFGENLIACHSSDGKILMWAPEDTDAAAITGAPTNVRAVVVTDERHVMAIGGSTYPRRIAWSSREDPEDWDYASTTNTAGFIDVESDAPLLHAVKVREGILVFTESDIFLVRYVGLPFVYGVDRIATSAAPFSPMSVATFDGRAAWLGREAFYLYDGGSVRPIPCDVQDWVFDTIDRGYARYTSHASNNGLFPEVWFFYPSDTSTDGNPDRYVIWNYAEQWWSIGAMSRTAMAEAGVFRYPLASTTGDLYQHEYGQLANGATRVGSVYAETSAMTIDAQTGNVVSVLGAQPDSYRGADATSFTFYSRFTREGSESVHGPYNCRSSGYMDVRLTGRDLRLRVAARKDDNWTVGAMRLEVQQRGRR